MKHVLLFTAAFGLFFAASAQIGFTPNMGQFADQNGNPASNVLLKSTGTGLDIYVTTTGLSYVFAKRQDINSSDAEERLAQPKEWSAIHMELLGAHIGADNMMEEDELPGVSNYYYPHCPHGILGVKSYHKVTFTNIYPGIDWVITADDANGVAHDFVVHENGKYSDIQMQFTGLTAPLDIDAQRRLILHSSLGTVYEGGLKVLTADHQPYMSAFFNINGNRVNYLIPRCRKGQAQCPNKNRAMIIDPPLQWSAPQASSGYDYGTSVVAAKDGTGDVMGGGQTDGVNFPVQNATQGLLYGTSDAVVFRLDGNGTRQWSTFFGGMNDDIVKGISTDANGNCYTTGYTDSQDLPVMNSLQANYGGGVYDAFIAKYNSAGAMQWSSWRGGTGTDYGMAIASDNAGTVYVVGYTNTTVNFPLLNAIHTSNSGVYDGFVMRLNTAQTMQWSTYYGGTDEDKFRSVSIDALGQNIFIAGNTVSGNFPTAGNPFQLFNANSWTTSDAIVMKMSVNQSVVFASYCGGNDEDYAYGVTSDASGNIYAVGYTQSSDFPKVDPGGSVYSDTTIGSIGTQDAFLIKCNPTGTQLLWSTYFGGSAPDFGFAIAYDQFVGVYICGNTASTDMPVMQPADLNYYQSTHGDGGNYNDMWIAWFDTSDSLRWSTYYGGGQSDEAYSISVGLQNEIFVLGTDSSDISVVKFNPGVPTTAPVNLLPGITDITVYPNLATDQITASFNSPVEGITAFDIYDNAGRLVKHEESNFSPGTATYRIDVASLAGGSYFVHVKTPVQEATVQFVKQ